MAGKGGRPPAITAEVEEKLLQFLQAGVPRKDAAAACGVDDSTFYRHVRRSTSFASQVEKADAEAVAANVLIIRKAARDGTWQAAAWWLERRRAEDWGRKDKMELTGKDGGPLQVEVYLPENGRGDRAPVVSKNGHHRHVAQATREAEEE